MGVAVGEFFGGPAVVEQFVVAGAGEGEFVDVSGAAGGPFFDVVDFAEVARCGAAGCGAAAVCGVQDDALAWGGDAFGAAEVDGALSVGFEEA